MPTNFCLTVRFLQPYSHGRGGDGERNGHPRPCACSGPRRGVPLGGTNGSSWSTPQPPFAGSKLNKLR
jgi:hypothetical protein